MRSKDFALINAVISDKNIDEFYVIRPHNLSLIMTNIDKDLRGSGNYRRAAHIAYMINSLNPFSSNNKQTALISMTFYLKSTNSKLPSFDQFRDFAALLDEAKDSVQLSEILNPS